MPDAKPLTSCIMPTYNRRRFVPQAVRYFLRQDYEPRELIIVDDGTESVADLIPNDDRIRYFRLNAKLSIGAKRNLACEQARGHFILHWDDDDWHAPHRIRYQVETMLQQSADLCGLRTVLFYDERSRAAWQYVYPAHERFWVHGNSFCYTRAFWQRNRFADVDVGEDTRLIWNGAAGRMIALDDHSVHVSIMHSGNVSAKQGGGTYWRPYDPALIRRLLGEDFGFYEQAAGQTQPASDGLARGFLIARTRDLALTEFAAYNHGCDLPPMRRWELPWALHAAQFENTSSVLDCTINPVTFGEHLRRLYPHVHYRHWSPIQNGQFVLPFGIPDESYDRVLCINTLEHLLRGQREQLVADLARKLKTGGLLLLTSDYYFDSSWANPAFLNAGVMSQDRQEMFNGWNKITPSHWNELCKPNGLALLPDAKLEEPTESDLTCYRNPEPFPHACIAAVYSKGPFAVTPRKSALLALLTWNTRDISIDSLRAYVVEAEALRRLGHDAYVCVCDNGSTDGTQDALRALDGQIEIPHRFIYNSANLGNSIARNQIIDYMLECGADYVLFMDGDIELVPFSSVAMMRYMENSGHWLGCIGADSAGQTPSREHATRYLYSLDGLRIEDINLVAWTQYGMFRRSMFKDGIRFDENAPFDGPGWGFEDNDLAFQMDVRGYRNQRFFGMIYLHRAVRSSARIMRQQGLDPNALCVLRQQYVLQKWAAVPAINSGPLIDVRRAIINL